MKLKDIANRIGTFVRDYYNLLRSGLFMHSAYARHNLETKWLFWAALAHYMLIGEGRGLKPNPFFDPLFFKQQSGTEHLIDYLHNMNLWRYPASDFFDSRWYTERYSADLAITENPLKHFWRVGLDRNDHPSLRFDTVFFKRAIARGQENLKDYAFWFACEPHSDIPMNVTELERRQRDFYDKIELKTLKRVTTPEKRFLVFIQSGQDFDPKYDPRGASFDLLINYYDASTHIGEEQYVFAQRGTKFTAIRKILDLCPEVFLAYDAVLFLDDDIIISQTQIDALFSIQAEHHLDLLQASLSQDSECYYPILKQPLAGSGLRPISGVEIMMPLVSRRALAEFGWVFGESISGWSVDLLLSREVRTRFGNTIALCGDVVATHPRSTDLGNNPFYKYLAEHGLNPHWEAGRIAIKFGVNDKMSAIDFRILELESAEQMKV